jgi:hypothetical protein
MYDGDNTTVAMIVQQSDCEHGTVQLWKQSRYNGDTARER